VGEDWKWGFFQLVHAMVSACCWRVRLCFGRGRDRGVVLYSSLFLLVLGWWVGMCLYTRVLDVSLGVGRTPEEPEEYRLTKVKYTCRLYMCTQYICLYMLGCGF